MQFAKIIDGIVEVIRLDLNELSPEDASAIADTEGLTLVEDDVLPGFIEEQDGNGDGLGTFIPPVSEAVQNEELNSKQFSWLLARTGLGQVWDALEQHSLQQDDLETYADLIAERNNSAYRLSVTLMLVAQFRPSIEQLLPDFPIADLSEETITMRWTEAQNRQFLNNTVSTGET